MLSDAVREAYASYLRDWDEKGAPWEYWMERTESARTSFAGLVGADNDEVAVTASVSAGVNAVASGLRLGDGRDRIVVSDFEFPTVGPDLARTGGARLHRHPRGAGRRARRAAGSFEAAIDERDGARRGHAGLLPQRRLHRPRGRHQARARARRAGAGRRLPGDRHDADRRARARRRPARRRRAEVPAGLGRPRLPVLPARAVRAAAPDGDRLVRGSDVFAMDIQDYSPAADARRFQAGTPPIPSIYAGIAGIELMKEVGIAETRAHVAHSTRR